MDVLYIPQLDEGDGGGDSTAGRYRLLKRVPEDGTVNLTDRAVTRVELTANDPLRIVVPPLVKGAVRDFFVRLVITADEIPEVTFAAPSGETISSGDVDEDVFKCEVGVDVFAVAETDQGVEFDPCGGELDKTKYTFKLGAQYSTLPKPTRTGYVFQGWFTAAEEGIEIKATDRCKTGVTKLYAQWEVYVDPFVDAICPAKNLTFFSNDVIRPCKARERSPSSGRCRANRATTSSTSSWTVRRSRISAANAAGRTTRARSRPMDHTPSSGSTTRTAASRTAATAAGSTMLSGLRRRANLCRSHRDNRCGTRAGAARWSGST